MREREMAHASHATLHSLPGADDITRGVTPNGIVVLSRANFNSPSVVIKGYLPAGALFDPDDKLGLADFSAAALMRGTEKRSFSQIYEALEAVGAGLGVASATHTAGFSGRALAEDLDLLLGLLAEVLRWPVFPEKHVERLRAQLLTALAIRAQDTEEMASLAFDQIAYAGHPYSRPEDGYPETVSAIQRDDLVAFHQEHYGPDGMVIALVGAVEPARAVDKVAQAFADWQNLQQAPPPDLPPVKALEKVITQRVALPGKSQADMVIGAVGPARRSADYYAAALGNSVLGQFGLMGRIGEAVREKAGLAYYAASHLSGGVGPGPWYVEAGVDPENVERTVDLIIQEIRRFVSAPVSEEELADSQASFIGRLPLSLEANAGVASALLNLERYQLPLDHYRGYADMVRAVGVNDVLEAARRYLDPERLAIAVAGPPGPEHGVTPNEA